MNVPQWIVSGEIKIYVGTFLMPTLAYSLFILVVHFTKDVENRKAWKSFLVAIAIPIGWYILSLVVIPFWKPVGRDFSMHFGLILIITGNLIFLFFLVRAILILTMKKSKSWQKYQLVWKIPISLIFPIIGLLLNNSMLSSGLSSAESGIFGNFHNHWFYILAVLNGLFICLPNIEQKIPRLLLFIGRSVTFAYTFYFFLVFLPFLPLSVTAIVGFGVGFLILAPQVLFFLQINELSKDYKFLKLQFSNFTLRSISILGFLVIPLFITIKYCNDRNTLNETLDYIYSPDYSKEYNLDKASLQSSLSWIKTQKDNRNSGIFGSKQPYLSSYFNWIVLDNLTLSDAKINTIESIFNGKTSFNLRKENILNKDVEITNISTKSTYDTAQKAWKSWVNLEITNNSTSAFPEYATTIKLPNGAWISDYYLYIGDRKEMGILAEKKTAMWVFSNIRGGNRDPGILYYLTGNKVAFRVFPFTKAEVRKTGFEILHKTPIQFMIDDYQVNLGDSLLRKNGKTENDHAIYLSNLDKHNLKKVTREPYFHYIIDATDKNNVWEYTNRIENLNKKYPNLANNAKVSFVTTYVTKSSGNTFWKSEFENQNFEGGYYIDRGIKSALYDSYKSQTATYPVIIAVTDDIQEAIFTKDFSDWQFTFPETDLFYHLNESENLAPHSLITNPIQIAADTNVFPFKHTTLAYKLNDDRTEYISDNENASIILKQDVFNLNTSEIKEKDWNSALSMQAKWRSQVLHPETADEAWLNLVKYSFISKIMSPVTSYLAVENEAQKAILKKKQEEVLSGNRSLDLDENSQRMSEPSLIVLAILLVLMLWRRQRKNKKVVTP
jgi:hypothetical protein